MKREEPTFSGWCVVYNEVCSNGDIFTENSLLYNNDRMVPLLLNHDRSVVLGYVHLRCRLEGVFFDAYMHEPSAVGDLVHELIREQRLRYISIGLATDTPRGKHEIERGLITEVSICIHDNAKNKECMITRVSSSRFEQ